jgi:hypothetical protein
MLDPRCPVTLRHLDVAAYRAPRLIGILTLDSLQSPRADVGRAFSATLPSTLSVLSYPSAIPQAHPVHGCETSCFAESFCFPFERVKDISSLSGENFSTRW